MRSLIQTVSEIGIDDGSVCVHGSVLRASFQTLSDEFCKVVEVFMTHQHDEQHR